MFSGWTNAIANRGNEIEYPWDDVPLQIKTVKATYSICVDARTKEGADIGQFKIQDGSFTVTDCLDGGVLENLPYPSDDLRIWTIVKNGAQGFTITCNEVIVAKILFSTLIKDENCAQSKWLTEKTEKIVFNLDWDKSKAFRGLFSIFKMLAKNSATKNVFVSFCGQNTN